MVAQRRPRTSIAAAWAIFREHDLARMSEVEMTSDLVQLILVGISANNIIKRGLLDVLRIRSKEFQRERSSISVTHCFSDQASCAVADLPRERKVLAGRYEALTPL
jgi:hypothetical protein